MRIGYFEHWSQPPYAFVDFLRQEGIELEKLDYHQKDYWQGFDVILIEQNGFNDYIENDELNLQAWVRQGGICLFMHQDYRRWAPGFLPEELGYVQLIHRHVVTISGEGDDEPYKNYMMPWVEPEGKGLFKVPETITGDELIDWRIRVNSFDLVPPKDLHDTTETVRTAALSCYLANPAWKILGSYMDPAVRDGALILRGDYGKGMYFLNQILFPEELTSESERCLAFWRKYVRNLLSYFERFKAGQAEPEVPVVRQLPIKRNYTMSIHVHSLDWFGCDSAPGTINALMRYMGVDICSLAIKNLRQFEGKFSAEAYSDDKVLFLNGQEYHPFNWNDRYKHLSHNNYHMLAMGVDPEAYTDEFTRSLFGDQEVEAYLKRAIQYVHDHHGVVSTAHPWCGYWRNYDYDAVDREVMCPLSGTDIEEHWLAGNRIPVLSSVDLFGMRRMFDNPAVNFIYLQGDVPSRDSVVRAVKARHTMAGVWFKAADVYLGEALPGDEVATATASRGTVHVSATVSEGLIRSVRVYSGKEVIACASPDTVSVDLDFPLSGLTLDRFVRVEVEGEDSRHILVSTPFYLV